MADHTGRYVGASSPVLAARVMVPESQLDDAERIRKAFGAGDYAIDEDFDVNP